MNLPNKIYTTHASTTNFKISSSAKKTVDGIMGIPWGIFDAIEAAKTRPDLSNDEIREMFISTGYEYASGLADYHLSKRRT